MDTEMTDNQRMVADPISPPDRWRDAMIEKYNLEQTIRGVGRPKNGG